MKILWVHTHAPWSDWTNSGASRALCMELRERNLLHAALGPDFVSRIYAKAPGFGYRTMLRARRRWPWLLPADECWESEDQGTLGRWTSQLPDGSPVVYVFDMPRPSVRKGLRRFLFLNLSALDARKTGTFGFDKMPDTEFEAAIDHQRQILGWADGVITPSTYAADSISRDFGYPRDKITPFGYGAGMSLGETTELTIERFNAANILFVGRDWERKGGPLVHAAWRRVREKIPHSTLTIIGPRTAPISGPGVRFVGYLDKTKLSDRLLLLEEYASASVFCMPTHCEPWGLVFSEAAATGTPIVSFREWSLPDIVEQGITGHLVVEHDADSLAEGLLNVLRDPQRALAMGLAARRRTEEVLNWPRAVDRLLTRVLPGSIRESHVKFMQMK